MGARVDLFDMLRGDYPQPNCPSCGRFAHRTSDGHGWQFNCSYWTGEYWEHV
jgi:hypothetical protein